MVILVIFQEVILEFGIEQVLIRTVIQLHPDGFNKTAFNIDYISASGNVNTARFTASLKSTVANASTRESIASIKANVQIFCYTG